VKHPPAEIRELILQGSGLGVDLDEVQATRLIRFEELLTNRAVAIHAVAASDIDRIRERHVLDSLRAAPLVRSASLVYDLGSGAGLPGVVVACAFPDVRVVLVERRRNRAAFLEVAVDGLPLPNAEVFAGSVEDLSEAADACLARAFAPLDRSWQAARRVLRRGGRLIYFAGRELEAAGPIQAPDGAVVEEVVRTPVLESAGPLVIMTRQ
jgi:16S rRNA (guanine527-N7)-methyltransferase